jgi:TRAP-type C4-dicarboxylate transport system permease large subunit
VIHFGVTFQLAIMIGLLTPPVGILLFVISGAGNVHLNEMIRNLWPFYLALVVIMVLVAFFPSISMWLVEKLGANIA